MKRIQLRKTRFMSARMIPVGVALSVAAALISQDANAALTVNLGQASDFAVLAGAGITIVGGVDSTTISGDIGSYATTSITGLGNVILNGVNHAGDAVTQQGKTDLALAISDAAGRASTVAYGPIYDLGGSSLGPGVFSGPSSFAITGDLTLNAGGDPNAVWIFQMGSTLITGTGSNVFLTNGAKASNVFWQVGSSATLGTDSSFEGTILAQDAISLNTGASLIGRALALTGTVTMDNNTIQVPEAGSTLLFSAGLLILAMRRRRL